MWAWWPRSVLPRSGENGRFAGGRATIEEQFLPDLLVRHGNRKLREEDVTVYGDGSHTRSFCYVTDLIERSFDYHALKKNCL